MPKLDINQFPLIAITEVMDMSSVDAALDGLSTVEDIMEEKRDEIARAESYKDWGLDWKQERPVYIEPSPYGSTFRNGHHRATHAADVGLLFIHYTNDHEIGWRQWD